MMSFYRTSAPMPFYGGDYRPDDEPPPEAVLEEKRIMDHQLRRPSPSRWSSSATSASSIRPPVANRQSANRSLRVRPTGGSPRRSLQRSSGFGNRRSMTNMDRGRTASMPAVPIVRATRRLSYWKSAMTVFWIAVILGLDPDPVTLYRAKNEMGHEPSNRKATVVSAVAKSLKAIVMIIQSFKSAEILKTFRDLDAIEGRLEVKDRTTSVALKIIASIGVSTSVLELLFDYPLSSFPKHRWAFLEGVSRICLYTIDLQFCCACIRLAKAYQHLYANLRPTSAVATAAATGARIGRGRSRLDGGRTSGLPAAVSGFAALSGVAARTNRAYAGQLSLSAGLHFAGALVDVYLFCFHALTLDVPWTVDSIGGVRALNNLLRLSAVSGSAHYAVKQPNFGNVPRPDGPMLEEYRLRSFSITASGVCNLGDFVRYSSPPSSTRRHPPIGKRDSCPASVSSTPQHQQHQQQQQQLQNTSCGAIASSAAATSAGFSTAVAASSHTVCTEFSRFRKPSTALINKFKANDTVESYKVALLGAPGVGKTTISVQFSTSDYICVYDTSIDEDCACRTIRVMINGQEAELTIIDIPYVEMSIETLCSTYNPNVFIVMYSVVDERSFDIAEQMLLFLWKGEYIHTKGVILVGNKSDLERTRKIQTNVGRNLAYSWNCKFIETSSGIDHNVDKLLVGILAQIKLNPLRERMYNSKRKKYSVTKLYKDFLAYLRGVKSSENLFSI